MPLDFHFEVIDKCLIGFPTFGHLLNKECRQIDSYDLIVTFHDGLLSAYRYSRLSREREPGEEKQDDSTVSVEFSDGQKHEFEIVTE